MIIGGSGSGKSWLAKMLGTITGLPVFHIDPMYWKAGWVQRDMAETHQMVRSVAELDHWIFEGNNSSSFADRLDRADHLVFLDFPTWLRVWGVFTRTIQSYGKTRPDMAEGCPERYDWAFTKWVLFGYPRGGGRDRCINAFKTAPEGVQKYHLKSRRDVKRFLAQVVRNYDQSAGYQETGGDV